MMDAKANSSYHFFHSAVERKGRGKDDSIVHQRMHGRATSETAILGIRVSGRRTESIGLHHKGDRKGHGKIKSLRSVASVQGGLAGIVRSLGQMQKSWNPQSNCKVSKQGGVSDAHWFTGCYFYLRCSAAEASKIEGTIRVFVYSVLISVSDWLWSGDEQMTNVHISSHDFQHGEYQLIGKIRDRIRKDCKVEISFEDS